MRGDKVLFPKDETQLTDISSLDKGTYFENQLLDENNVMLYYSVICNRSLLRVKGFLSIIKSLVLDPIVKTLQKIRKIAEHPLDAVSMEEQESFVMEHFQDKTLSQNKTQYLEESEFETFYIEKLIMRTGYLLALCFGQAGSEIIASNMKASGFVNPMLSGKKVLGVFGFCDIRNFNTANEILKEDVMEFINKIAGILHKRVDQYCGHTNKSIGQAFLIVWKFKEKDTTFNSSGDLELIESELTRNFADLSIISCLNTIGDLHNSTDMRKYCNSKKIKIISGNDFIASMTFGLHYGWAIESAIGSDFKIDVSYLSPNVNIASRLEAASKQFGTDILISGQLQKILSTKCKKNLRFVDRVTVKGSVMPIELYTVDLNPSLMDKRPVKRSIFDLQNLTQYEKKRLRIMEQIKKKELKNQLENGVILAGIEFSNQSEIHQMRKEFTEQFIETWNVGLNYYLSGDWKAAQEIFLKTQSWFKRKKDGPSTALLRFMEEYNYKSPSDWKGFRSLLNK